MSKVIKEEKQRNSHALYKSNYEAKKEVNPLENKSKLIIQTEQAQKSHLHILKSEPNFNQKDIPKNNQHEKAITTIISSRRYNQGKEEKKNSNISMNPNNKNNEANVMFVSKRKNSNISKEIQNENININNLTNIQKSTTYLIAKKDKENKEIKENKINNSKNSNTNENMTNRINDCKLVINNKRQSNVNTKLDNGNKAEQQRAQSQSKSNLQNNQNQYKYQVKTQSTLQKNTSELTQSQFQNISKYSFNTSKIIKTPKTPSYRTNTAIASSRTNVKNIQQPQERKFIIFTSVDSNSKKQEILPKQMNLDRSSQNIYTTNSNKSEVNNKNKITEQNNANYLRSNSLIKLPEKNNIKGGPVVSNLQNKNENIIKSPLSNRDEVKSNIQIHTITQIKNKQEKEKDKINDVSSKKSNIVISENKYKKSNEINNNKQLSLNIHINKTSQDISDKNNLNEKKRNITDINRSMKNISNITSHSIDDTKKNKKNEVVVAPRKHEVIVSKINANKTYNVIDIQDKRTKTPNICKVSSKLDAFNSLQNYKTNFNDKINLNNEVGKEINNGRKNNIISYKDLRSVNIDSKNNNNKEVKNIIKDNSIQNNNKKNDNNIELMNNKRKGLIDS